MTKQDLVYDYDEEADVLRIRNKACDYSGRNQIDSSEVFPGVWAIYITGDEKNFLTIEILKAKRRDLKSVNDFLEQHYGFTTVFTGVLEAMQ
jgi:hypothetical protein